MEKEKLFTSNYFWSFSSSFLMFFAFYLLLPILPMYLLSQFDAGKSLTGIILSSYTITALLIRPFGGYMVDTFPRKMLLVVCYCLFTAFFGGYLMASTLFAFALLRALHGVTFGMVTIANSTVAVDVMPSSRRNEGIGYYGISTNLAMAIGPMVSLIIYDLYQNYHTIFILSLITSIVGIMCVLMIKTPAHEKREAEPISLDRFFLTKGLPCALIFTLLAFNYGILTTYVAIYGVEEVGLTSGTGMFFVTKSVGMVLSRLLTARWMKAGKLNYVVGTGIVIMIISYAVFIFLKSAVFFYLSALFLGLAYGYVCPAFQAIFINLATHNQRGTANSTYYISWDLGIGLGVLAGGYIAEMADYSTSYIVGLVLICLAFLLFRFAVAGYYERNKLV